MAKSSAQLTCERLIYKAAHLTEIWCRSCGLPAIEAHHIILKSQGDWKVQYDIDFFVGLCEDHHRHAANAPHVSPKRFEAEVLPRLLNGMDPVRAAKIQAYLSSPRRPQRDKPDFKEIRAEIKALVADRDNDNFDADIPQNRRSQHA